jgi:hypothetical protein
MTGSSGCCSSICTGTCCSSNSGQQHGAVDHSLYLERQKQALLAAEARKTPCGPVTARDASFQTHLHRLETVRRGLVAGVAVPVPAGCCYSVVPQVFAYDDCWYIRRQAAALGTRPCG